MRRKLIVFTALYGLSALADAQTQALRKPTPEEMQTVMDASMVSMLPMLGRMTEVQLEAQLKVAERPETAERIATFKKNLFEALRRKGFTAEQSLQITNSTPLPSAPPSGKVKREHASAHLARQSCRESMNPAEIIASTLFYREEESCQSANVRSIPQPTT